MNEKQLALLKQLQATRKNLEELLKDEKRLHAEIIDLCAKGIDECNKQEAILETTSVTMAGAANSHSSLSSSTASARLNNE